MRKSSHIPEVIGVFVVLLVLYVFTPPFVIWGAQRVGIPLTHPALVTFYLPCDMLCQYCPPYDRYIGDMYTRLGVLP